MEPVIVESIAEIMRYSDGCGCGYGSGDSYGYGYGGGVGYSDGLYRS